MTLHRPLAAALVAASLAPAAQAQDPLELGVIRNEDIHVVQKLMYPKDDRTEFGVHLGVMPFDPYLTTPNAQLSFNAHFNEKFSFSLMAGGGYGFKTTVAKTLESPTYGVVPYEYRYLAGLLAGVEYAPIYAKMNLNGSKIVHFDVYGALRGGANLGMSVLPDNAIGINPTLSPGVGARIFAGQNTTVRVEVRDDLMLERRSITESWHFKQSGNVSLGLTFLSPVKDG